MLDYFFVFEDSFTQLQHLARTLNRHSVLKLQECQFGKTKPSIYSPIIRQKEADFSCIISCHTIEMS